MRRDSEALDNTPLADAVERNDIAAATTLLRSGADPNRFYTLSNRRVRSAFWDNAASQWRCLGGIAASFDRPQQESLLWLTANQNQTEMALLLTRYGANPNLMGNDKDWALLRAAGTPLL